jgi:heptosyltransferase-2
MDLISAGEVYDALRKSVRTQKAVFFDRDGTLCRDADYLSRMEDLEIFPSVEGLVPLKDAGFWLIGVTNQSGIARGLVQEDFVQKVDRIFVSRYGFDDFYYCPHHPGDHCNCRKPEPGMLIRARNGHAIDLRKSFVVGDKDEDMILARTVGARGVLVRTGKVQSSAHADAVAGGLDDAVKIILSMDRERTDA